MKKLRSTFLTNGAWFRLLIAAFLVVPLILIILNGLPVNANYTPDKIIVFASSSHEDVLTLGIFPAFKQMWKVKTGQDLEIETIIGPSATLAGQIVISAPADVALFSNPYHVQWLKLWGLVEQDTQANVFGHSPIVIVTRPDAPISITGYKDLTSSGLRLVHGDPRKSGAGEWALLAEYGSALLASNDQLAAQSQIEDIWKNVVFVGPSARGALTLFELGAGDALITYEQEALFALDRGVALQIVIPTRTIITQHVAVIVDANISRRERPTVQAFMDFLVSPTGQEIFSQYHLRPADLNDGGFPPINQPFMVEDLGGWKHAYNEVIENIWESEIEPGLNLDEAPLHIDLER